MGLGTESGTFGNLVKIAICLLQLNVIKLGSYSFFAGCLSISY